MEMSADPSITVQALTSNENPSKSDSVPTKTTKGILKKKSKSSKSKSKSRSGSPSKAKSAGNRPSKKLNSSKSNKSCRKGRAPIGLEGAVDILSEVAMNNLSYIAHEAQGALVMRGFPWAGIPKTKKERSGKAKNK